MKSLILCGFYSAGKSTVGQKCAHQLEKPFIDTDFLIESVHNKKPRQLWNELGEQRFRDLEEKVIASLEMKHHVIALGGGVLLRQNNRLILKNLGTIIYLKASTETLLKRIEQRGFPAFFKGKEEFEKLAAVRFPIYESICDWVIETDALTQKEVADKICKKYG